MRFSTMITAVVIFLLAIDGIGCGGAFVADIGGEKISVEEFEQTFAKNNGGREAAQKTSIEDRQKFLDLYTKFRLKVKEAKAAGYDKDHELVNELNDYRKNLAVSYMIEKEITKPALERLYQRKLKEVRASHILIRLQPNAAPADTLAAFTTAKKIIDSLSAGIPFEKLAVNNSQDPSAQYNKGDLYYFSGGMMVPEFEDAVYSMKVGEFSHTPTRTQFGYHIIKLTDMQTNQKAVHVSHIMKRLAPNANADDSVKAAQALLAVRDSVMKGAAFADLAMRNSDDTYSSPRGGDLGYIDRGRTVREFDDVIFRMKDGDVSTIVKTQFGLHLVKRFDAQGVQQFKDLEQDLKSEYQRYRFQHDYDLMVEKIKKQYGFMQDSLGYAAFVTNVDTSKTTNDSTWDSTYTAAVRSKVIYTFDGQKISIQQLITAAKINQELRNLSFNTSTTFKAIVDKIGISLVIEHYAHQIENSFPDFAQTMKEYEDGILLFKAEQENVWNKVAPTDSALRVFYGSNHSKYTWPDRVNVQEIFVLNDSIATVVKKVISGYTIDSLVAKKTNKKTKKVQYDTLKIAITPISFDSAAAIYNKRGATVEKRGVWGLQPVTTNVLTKRAWESNGNDTTSYFPNDGGFSFIKVIQKDAAREKTFDEAQSELSGAFQEYETKRIEELWYESLKKKYPVVINTEGLSKTFASPAGAASTKQP